MIVCLLQVAALYVLLRSPFLAVVQVFIYVGAVMVLFLFAVMLLDLGKERLTAHIHGQKAFALPAVLLFFIFGVYLMLTGRLTAPEGKYTDAVLQNSTEVLGKLLYTKYLFPFEIVSVLLLVALVGAIVLILRVDRGTE